MRRRPPRLAEWLLGRLIRAREREAILGDLEEAFHERVPGPGRWLWYWGQAALVGVAVAWSRRRRTGAGGRMGIEAPAAFVRELRITSRGLLRRPGFAFLAVLTIVLGVGAVTAGYGLLHRVVLRPLAFEDTERLVTLGTRYGGDVVGVTGPEHLEVAEHAEALSAVAAFVEPRFDPEWIWTGGPERTVLRAVRVTGGFFSTLGVSPTHGSLAGGPASDGGRVVLSRDFWVRELGGDPAAIGRAMGINGEPHVVAGVLPASFEFPIGPEPVDVWILFDVAPTEAYRDMPLAYRTIGRLAPGVGYEQAEAELLALVASVRSGVGAAPGEALLRPLRDHLIGSARRPLVLLAVASGLVLLVAALDLALLVSARNLERLHEMRVRLALGASRRRLIGHLLGEAGVLSLIGGGLGALAASAVLRTVFDARPAGLVRVAGAETAPEVILVGLVFGVVPALLVAALPARWMARASTFGGSRTTSRDRRGRRLASALAAVGSCVVFALLVVAVLVFQSLREVMAVDPGFDASSTVALEIFPAPERYSAGEGAALAGFLDEVQRRLEDLPGVAAVGTISNLPMSPDAWSGSLRIEGRDDVPADEHVVVDWELAGPGYFEAAGIPVVRGRGFDRNDRADGPPVVVVNETMALRWWPEGGVIGARISGGGGFRTVVGVVGDVKQRGLDAGTRGSMYLPVLQMPFSRRQELVVRVEGEDPAVVLGTVRAALRELAPDLAFGSARTLDSMVRGSVGAFRLRAILLGSFAAVGLLLGMAGIYGVTALGVRAASREVGIRIAMGAEGGAIMAKVLGDALRPVAVGLGCGLAIVVLAAPALRSLLFGVSATDPAWVGGVAALLLASGAAAVLPSALRARRVDPVRLLRRE